MDDFEGLITYEEVIDSSIHSYYNVEEGTYKILFHKYDNQQLCPAFIRHAGQLDCGILYYQPSDFLPDDHCF